MSDDKKALSLNHLGAIYFAKQEYPQAIEAYRQAISLKADYYDAYYNLALALSRLDQDEAITVYEKLLDLNSDYAAARFQLACLLMQREQYQAALNHFHIIEQAHPSQLETLANAAVCEIKLGKSDAAISEYSKILEIKNDDHQVLFNLGVLHAERGEWQQAISYYLRANEVGPNDYATHYNLAKAYLAVENRESALLHFKEVKRLKPEASIDHRLQVNSLFDSYADHYDLHLLQGLQYQVPEQLWQAMQAYKNEKGQWDILDLGCGTGLCGALFRPMANLLVGVDIAAKMLEQAAQKNIYDGLVQADIQAFLRQGKQSFDLVLAGDVFGYIGDLQAIFHLMPSVLNENGWLAFTVEAEEQEKDYVMNLSGRFAYSRDYFQHLASQYDFQIKIAQAITLRMQDKVPVQGYLYVMHYPGTH